MVGFIRPVVIPVLRALGLRNLCQIGVSEGDDTDSLLALPDVRLALIDPCVDADLALKYRGCDNVSLHKGVSLTVLPTLTGEFDGILIDGDHNWYTVFNELRVIHERSLVRKGGVILLHDVGWPYGRRDMYYFPESIPVESRHPYARRNVIRGACELSPTEGGGCSNALHEGGPQNGVLTAVEDFLRLHRSEYFFVCLDVFHGLGILFKRDAIRVSTVARLSRAVGLAINGAMVLVRSCGAEGAIQNFRRGASRVTPARRA